MVAALRTSDKASVVEAIGGMGIQEGVQKGVARQECHGLGAAGPSLVHVAHVCALLPVHHRCLLQGLRA